MITRNPLSIMLAVAAVALATWLTSPAFAAAYATPAPQGPGIEYVYFDPTAPPSPSASGWVGNGKYDLPPDIGGVSVDTSAFGSIVTDAQGNPSQAFVVRLTIANSGTQPMTIDPATVQLVDKAGRVLVGARAFSGNNRVTTDTIAAGGRDVLQLEFPLPPGADVKTLEIEDVDLPYVYGATPYVTRLGFVPAAGTATYFAPQTPAATYPTTPEYTTENNYYSAPYDTSSYDYGYPDYAYSGWWGPTWGWDVWWPGSIIVVGSHHFHHHGDGDFDADDGSFGHHSTATGTTTADPAVTTKVNGKTTGAWGGKNAGAAVTTNALGATSNFGRPFGSTGTGVHPPYGFAPRTTGYSSGATNNVSTFRGSSTPSFTTRSFSAPAAFSAPHFSGSGSAAHFSTASAPHFSGGGGGGGGAAFRSSGGGGVGRR